MTNHKSDLLIELIKIFVDKLLIAIILVGVGYFANHSLEQFKADQSFYGEINKIRVQRIADVWEEVYSFEDRFSAVSKNKAAILKACIDNKNCTGLETRIAEAQAPMDIEKLTKVVQLNRFWLGSEAGNAISAYIEAVVMYQTSMNAYKVDEKFLKVQKQLKEDVDKSRRDVESVVCKFTRSCK